MKKNVLITGGAGFIGSNLSLALIKKGYNIRVLDNLSKQIHGENPNKSVLYKSIKDKVDFIKGDVLDKEIWIKALKDQNLIIHLAAETGTGQSMYNIEKYTDVNIKGTAILLDLLTNNNELKVEKIIVASSRAIYGEGKYKCDEHGIVYPNNRNVLDMKNGDFNIKCPYCNNKVKLLATDELSNKKTTSIYGLTKQVQEEMLMITCKSLNIPIVSFRYQNVYGPGQSLSNPYTGILSIFSTRIKNNNEINIFEDGLESRDFVYIKDVVDATILGIENPNANNKVYNVGSGKRTSVLEVVQSLAKEYDSNIKYEITGNYRIGDIRHNFADLTKIKKDLGFSPKFSFEDGIKNFCKWVSTQDIKEDKFNNSFKEMKIKGLLK